MYTDSHISVAEVSEAFEEVHEVLWLPHLHCHLERPEGAVAGQHATLTTYHLPQCLTATGTIKVHVKLHLDQGEKETELITGTTNYSYTCSGDKLVTLATCHKFT